MEAPKLYQKLLASQKVTPQIKKACCRQIIKLFAKPAADSDSDSLVEYIRLVEPLVQLLLVQDT